MFTFSVKSILSHAQPPLDLNTTAENDRKKKVLKKLSFYIVGFKSNDG